jgi:hypothetical protein
VTSGTGDVNPTTAASVSRAVDAMWRNDPRIQQESALCAGGLVIYRGEIPDLVVRWSRLRVGWERGDR